MTERSRFWLITMAALLGVAATASLGRWQLERATEKEKLQAGIEARASEPVLDGAALAIQPDPAVLLQRRIVVRGQWLADQTVFLDNRQMNGRPGFFVVTPLRLEGFSRVVLVQRGWAPRNFEERARAPVVDTPPEMVEIEGRIAPAPPKLYELGASEPGPIRQNLDLAQFKAETGLPLLDVSIQQTGPAGDALARDWAPAGTGIDKHRAYAFQWFGLSALMALLYVWFQIVRRFFLRKPA